MATKSKKGTKAKQDTLQEPVLAPTPAGTTPEPEKAAEATESAIAGLSAFNVDKREPIVQTPDPNAIMFDEYGIDGSTYNIPIILKAILCELVRGRKNG